MFRTGFRFYGAINITTTTLESDHGIHLQRTFRVLVES